MEGVTIDGKWKIGAKIGSGEYSTVYDVSYMGQSSAFMSPGPYVIKVTPVYETKGKRKNKESQGALLLNMERMLYTQWLKDVPYVPRLASIALPPAYGDATIGPSNTKYRYLIIQKMGQSLEKLTDKEPSGLPSVAVAAIAHDMLSVLRALHQKGWVYVDMKPENIVLGNTERGEQGYAYLTDFGLAFRFDGFGSSEGGQENGTPYYISQFAQDTNTKEPRNDLQSLVYVLVDVCTGTLPWKHASSMQELTRIKQSTSARDLANMVPDVTLCDFIHYVYSLPPHLPKTGISYDTWIRKFHASMKRNVLTSLQWAPSSFDARTQFFASRRLQTPRTRPIPQQSDVSSQSERDPPRWVPRRLGRFPSDDDDDDEDVQIVHESHQGEGASLWGKIRGTVTNLYQRFADQRTPDVNSFGRPVSPSSSSSQHSSIRLGGTKRPVSPPPVTGDRMSPPSSPNAPRYVPPTTEHTRSTAVDDVLQKKRQRQRRPDAQARPQAQPNARTKQKPQQPQPLSKANTKPRARAPSAPQSSSTADDMLTQKRQRERSRRPQNPTTSVRYRSERPSERPSSSSHRYNRQQQQQPPPQQQPRRGDSALQQAVKEARQKRKEREKEITDKLAQGGDGMANDLRMQLCL